MKRNLLMSVMVLVIMSLVVSVSQNVKAQDAKTKKEMVKAKKYYCPHHPDQVSDKPGKCAVCGMALVEMKGTDKKPDTAKMKMDKGKMKGDMKKMDQEKMKMKKDMKMEMKKSKPDTVKMSDKGM